MDSNKVILIDKSRIKLRELRKKQKLSIDYVSERLGKTRAWLGQIERGDIKSIKKDDLRNLLLLYTGYTDSELLNNGILDNLIKHGTTYSNFPSSYNWHDEIDFIKTYFLEYFNNSLPAEEITTKLVNIHAMLRCLSNNPGLTSIFLENFNLLERIFENYEDLPADQYIFSFMKLTKKIQAILQEEINSTL